MYGCQQTLIKLKPDDELKAVLEFICQQANSLTNCGIYYARQLYFKTQKLIGKYDLEAQYKTSNHFKALYSQAAQQILRSVAESIQSFKKLRVAYNQGKIEDKPHLPNYRTSGGMALVAYPKQALKLVDDSIRIPLGNQIKCWFKLANFSIPMPSNLKFADIKELRILPRNGCFYAEFVYKLEDEAANVDPAKVLGIDHGIDNWLTCVDNLGNSFIIDGRHLKSVNQWYNKQIATIKEGKAQGFWSKKLAAITEKRNRQMRDAINKAARIVVNHCIKNQVGVIVFGWNKGQKQETSLGAKTNQKFVQIPTARLKERIAQLCEQYGIKFVETEESYTSKASFLDKDFLPTYGEKPKEHKYQFSGKRVKRGLYRTAINQYVNADCNGAANILRKVATTLGLDLSEVGRGALITPFRTKFWLSKESHAL